MPKHSYRSKASPGSADARARNSPKKAKQCHTDDPKVNTLIAAVISIESSATTSVAATPKLAPPTSFLTLPRELRHKILYLSCDVSIDTLDFDWDTQDIRWTRKAMRYRCRNKAERHEGWAKILNIALKGAIPEDVDYVLSKWEAELVLFENKCVAGMDWVIDNQRQSISMEDIARHLGYDYQGDGW
ncbi:hypothetical protein FKW77_001849 [Venturia effusa]|uniref:Uncharacterized protein n=1 Tax=Venturia effusa TaxID=50376 RepID=A0A517L8P8_9PEZI|nr:hypothetical protein FKW77_001849 [Venturia effusa]